MPAVGFEDPDHNSMAVDLFFITIGSPVLESGPPVLPPRPVVIRCYIHARDSYVSRNYSSPPNEFTHLFSRAPPQWPPLGLLPSNSLAAGGGPSHVAESDLAAVVLRATGNEEDGKKCELHGLQKEFSALFSCTRKRSRCCLSALLLVYVGCAARRAARRGAPSVATVVLVRLLLVQRGQDHRGARGRGGEQQPQEPATPPRGRMRVLYIQVFNSKSVVPGFCSSGLSHSGRRGGAEPRGRARARGAAAHMVHDHAASSSPVAASPPAYRAPQQAQHDPRASRVQTRKTRDLVFHLSFFISRFSQEDPPEKHRPWWTDVLRRGC